MPACRSAPASCVGLHRSNGPVGIAGATWHPGGGPGGGGGGGTISFITGWRL